jgi:hypothetical protein
MVKVNNVSDYAKTKRFWVIREVDGEYWFYSAFDDVTKAFNSCKELSNGTLIENSEISKND